MMVSTLDFQMSFHQFSKKKADSELRIQIFLEYGDRHHTMGPTRQGFVIQVLTFSSGCKFHGRLIWKNAVAKKGAAFLVSRCNFGVFAFEKISAIRLESMESMSCFTCFKPPWRFEVKNWIYVKYFDIHSTTNLGNKTKRTDHRNKMLFVDWNSLLSNLTQKTWSLREYVKIDNTQRWCKQKKLHSLHPNSFANVLLGATWIKILTSPCPIFPRIYPPFSTSIISPSIVSPVFSENVSFNDFQYFNWEPSVDERNPKQPPERYTTLFIMGFQLPTLTGESIPDFWLPSTVFTKELLRVHLGCSSGGPCVGFCHCWSYHWFQRLRGGLTLFSNVMSTRKTPPGNWHISHQTSLLSRWIVLFKFGGICFLVPWRVGES